MKELVLPEHLALRIEELYSRMDKEYERVAAALEFGCGDCPDNCCDSHFLHYTYAEWAYLWRGLRGLPDAERQQLEQWAKEHVTACKVAEVHGERPQVMCPLNQDGLCRLYAHRLLVCRTHGVPARMRRPDGQLLEFPGCFRCQEVVRRREEAGGDIPSVERTPLLLELVAVENELLSYKRHLYPKIRMTIADMIVQGPPKDILACQGACQ